jgi:hypothetical protein
MLAKIYMGVGIFLCVGLGFAFAMDWKAPDILPEGRGGSSSGGSRGFFFHSSGGGYGFGK